MMSMGCNPKTPLFPLAMAMEGETVRIASIRRGRHLQERLFGMGIHVDDTVEIVKRQGQGAVVIAKGGGRFALGGGMALKILVTKEG